MTKAFNRRALDKARYQAGIKSDEALGQKLGVSREAIRRWRAGESEPRATHLLKLNRLGVSFEELFSQSDHDVAA